jgi:hypothetical protein
MSHKLNGPSRRPAWRCFHDYYHLPAWRDRSCPGGSQRGKTACGSPVRQCSRDRLSPELPLVMSESIFSGSLRVLSANG